jgi:hypothetical protein
LGSVFDTTTRCRCCTVRDWSAALLEGAKIGTTSFLRCIERDGYTDKRYID